ncbi:hypothetical protein CO151_00135 [bacterium CG_4_9_14_3_um_filter_65_15]|nr:MAG: hypothetical protein CO151_00135 [bacterium CG_4_9_14_3_um_filter_65_15]
MLAMAVPAAGQRDAVADSAVIVARPGPGSPLDLQAAAAEVIRANPGLNAERLKRKELEGQMDQALSTGLPTLDITGDWSRGRDPSFALDSTFGGGDTFTSIPGADPWFNDFLGGFGSLIPAPDAIPAQTFWHTNLNLNWTIKPTKVLGAVGAARLGIERQEAGLSHAVNQTAEQAVTAYFTIVQASERVAALRAQIADQEELLSTVRMRHDLGLATSLDTLQAAVSLANTIPRLTVAKSGLRNAGSRLNVLMGRRPDSPLAIVNRVEVEWDPVDETAALGLAPQRPNLVAGARFVEILRRNRQAQQADHRPYLSVYGTYGYVGRTTDTLFDHGHDTWRAAVTLNIPVFDGLLTRGLVNETKVRIRRTEAELDAQRSEAELEVLEILGDLQSSREVLEATRLNLARSRDVLDESMLRLKLGKAGYLDVLVAQTNLAQARAALIDARYDVLSRTAAFKRALGFSPLQPLNSIPGLVNAGTNPETKMSEQ